MLQSKRNEPHFFDYWDCDQCYFNLNKITPKDLNKIRSTYSSKHFNMALLKKDPNLISFEKTPMYLFNVHAASRAKLIVPWAKIIIVLRDPVERAFSTFKMNYIRYELKNVTETHGKITFERCVNIDIQQLKNAGILQDSFWQVSEEERERRWVKYWRSWQDHILTEEEMCSGEVGRGLYYLQIERWLKHFDYGGGQNNNGNVLILKSENLLPHESTKKVDLKSLTDFIGIDELDIVAHEKIHTYTGAKPLQDETRIKLEHIFDPFNKKLGALLGKEWENPWPYTFNVKFLTRKVGTRRNDFNK